LSHSLVKGFELISPGLKLFAEDIGLKFDRQRRRCILTVPGLASRSGCLVRVHLTSASSSSFCPSHHVQQF